MVRELLLLVLFVGLAVISAAEEPGCPYGQEFIDECDNDCHCMDSKFYGCTRKACRPGQRSMSPKKCSGTADLPRRSHRRVFCHEGIVKVQNLEDQCLPGSSFMDQDYCNGCFCSYTGFAACTLMECLDRVPDFRAGGMEHSSTDITPDASPGCPHGEAFIDECGNQCRCSMGKFYGCTFKACADGKRPEVPMTCNGPADVPKLPQLRVLCHQGIVKIQSKDEKCIPGSEFMDECNSCFCSDSGVAGCTLKACIGLSRSVRASCQYGAAYIDECGNDCTCFGGLFYGCSRRGCPAGLTAAKPMSCHRHVKLPTRHNRRVVCHQGIVKVQRTEEECLPGSTYADDCNVCTCSHAGVPQCTERACLPKPKNVCVHGDEFIDECSNQCKCQNGEFYGCTFKACREGQTPEVPMKCDDAANLPHVPGRRVFCHEGKVKIQDKDAKCVPGSSFRDDCNTCTCSESGLAGCTLKACVSVPRSLGACVHGPHFIDECNNDCTCIISSYGCTRKACKPGETPEVPMKCEGSRSLPKREARKRVFCHEGKVKVQDVDDSCVPGSSFMDEKDCNSCDCSDDGSKSCTKRLCISHDWLGGI